MQHHQQTQFLCVGHKEPRFTLVDAELQFLCEDDLGIRSSWSYGAEHPDLKAWGHTLSEYGALFALRRRLSTRGPVPEWLALTQYRKFVSTHQIGTNSSNLDYARTIPPEGLVVKREDIVPPSPLLFVSRPADLKMTILEQYHKVHVLRDLLSFSSCAIDSGVITDREAMNMLEVRYVIPAPTLGLYDWGTFADIFAKLETVAMQFLKTCYVPRDGYQRRVVGFCLERLNSYLLLRELGFPDLQRQNFGWQIVASESAEIRPTV